MCIFCQIASGEIPSHKIYEDESVIAFFDIQPTSYGHALVVPKKHFDSFLTCDPETLHHVFEVAQALANRFKDTLNCDGVNILSNCGSAAGQSVEHFHVHIIPRYEDSPKENINIQFNEIGTVDFESLLANVKR